MSRISTQKFLIHIIEATGTVVSFFSFFCVHSIAHCLYTICQNETKEKTNKSLKKINYDLSRYQLKLD